jgi:hypothetical protein
MVANDPFAAADPFVDQQNSTPIPATREDAKRRFTAVPNLAEQLCHFGWAAQPFDCLVRRFEWPLPPHCAFPGATGASNPARVPTNQEIPSGSIHPRLW